MFLKAPVVHREGALGAPPGFTENAGPPFCRTCLSRSWDARGRRWSRWASPPRRHCPRPDASSPPTHQASRRKARLDRPSARA